MYNPFHGFVKTLQMIFHQKFEQLLWVCHSCIISQRNGALKKVWYILFLFSVFTTVQMALINIGIPLHKKRTAYQQFAPTLLDPESRVSFPSQDEGVFHRCPRGFPCLRQVYMTWFDITFWIFFLGMIFENWRLRPCRAISTSTIADLHTHLTFVWVDFPP